MAIYLGQDIIDVHRKYVRSDIGSTSSFEESDDQ